MLKFTFENLPNTVVSAEASLMVEGLRQAIGDRTSVEPNRYSDWDEGMDLEWDIKGGRIAAEIRKDGSIKFRETFFNSISDASNIISLDEFLAHVSQTVKF